MFRPDGRPEEFTLRLNGGQYQLDADLVPGAPTPLNVKWLVDHHYLTRIR